MIKLIRKKVLINTTSLPHNILKKLQHFAVFVSSGELTLEEFISGAKDHPDIMDMLTKMMDLTHVLEIIIQGQQKNAVN